MQVSWEKIIVCYEGLSKLWGSSGWTEWDRLLNLKESQ